jgi:hypothetical protein
MARGPAYPFINLEQAVNLTRKLYDYAKRTPANLSAVVKDKWEYTPTSSSGVKAIAALKYFGLAEVSAGTDKSESIKITDRAYRILVDEQDSEERKQALRDACLSPKAYKMCWEKWGVELPQSMRSSLIFNEGFIETTVDGFLTNYRKSLQFSGLLDSPGEIKRVEAPLEDEDSSEASSGAESPSAASISRSTPNSAPHALGVARPHVSGFPAKGVGMRQEVFALAEGDVIIQWPEHLSKDSFDDFSDWLKILERKIKRSVQVAAPSDSTKPDDVSGLV